MQPTDNLGERVPDLKVEGKVVGRLKISPHWICVRGCDIYALNHHRFEEMAIFDRYARDWRGGVIYSLFQRDMCCRLLNSRSLNTLELPEPIELNEDKGWSSELNEILLAMTRDGSGLVTDERIRSNGFVVKVRSDGSGAILLGVPRDVNFMGTTDLSVSIFFHVLRRWP